MFFAVNNIKSPHITLNHGVPQGSSISPILFILYVSDLPSPTHEYKIHRSQFADDICEFISAKQTRFIQQQLQNSINQITTYSGVYRIGLNARKTAQISFPGKRRTSEKNIKHVTINNANTNSQQSKISQSHLRLVTIIHNAHQINRSQSQTPHHAPTHHQQPVVRSTSSHHDSLIQNIRTPIFRIRSHMAYYKHTASHYAF